MAILKNIEWMDNTKNTIVHKYDPKNLQINKGSALTVREGQNAVFVDKGRLADVFLPGFYKLDTDNMPVLTRLMSWKYGFQTPFKSDIYFVNMTQFTNCKWGTLNPIMIYDPDFGNINIKGYGTFSFKVDDAYILLKELSGSGVLFRTEDIQEKLRSIVITGISDAFGSLDIPVSRFAGQLREVGQVVKQTLDDDFKEMGLSLTQFNVENFSFPEKVMQAMDESASLGIMRKNMDVLTQMRMADAMVEAAKNPGTGNVMGAGMGMGMGVGMGKMFNNMMGQEMGSEKSQPVVKVKCTKCGELNTDASKFCHNCGSSLITPTCPGCRREVTPGTKFCPNCGTKI